MTSPAEARGVSWPSCTDGSVTFMTADKFAKLIENIFFNLATVSSTHFNMDAASVNLTLESGIENGYPGQAKCFVT